MKRLLLTLTTISLMGCKMTTLFTGSHETQYLVTDSSMKTLSSENRRVVVSRKGNTLVVNHISTSNSVGFIEVFRIRSTMPDSAFTRYLLRDSSWVVIFPSWVTLTRYKDSSQTIGLFD